MEVVSVSTKIDLIKDMIKKLKVNTSKVAASKIITSNKIPSPEEIRKEFEKVIRDKFGASVQFHTEVAVPRSVRTSKTAKDSKDDDSPLKKIKFNYTPKQVKAHLDKNIVHQTEAKKALSIAICDHYNHVLDCIHNRQSYDFNYAKQNVLMLGPTGVGKPIWFGKWPS